VHPASGPTSGGNQVVVVGLNLMAPTAVAFGSVDGTGLQGNAAGTRVVVTAPPGFPGTIEVTVTTHKGTSASSPNGGYTYRAPTVTRVRPATAAAGSAVTIAGTDLEGTSAVLFGSTPAASVTVQSAGTRVVAIAPAGVTGVVPVALVTPSGSISAGTITLTRA
jgi:hypothetical protein